MEPTLEDNDYLNIILTNFQLHVVKPQNPQPLGRRVQKVLNAKKNQGRAYSNNVELTEEGAQLSMPLGMEYFQEIARKRGKKDVRFFTHKDGIPLLLGNDFIEKLLSNKNRP